MRKPREDDPTAAWLPLVLLLLAAAVSGAAGEIDVTAKIPVAVAENSTIKMACEYDLKDKYELYSIKWYKNKKEFYRFLPKELPAKRVFEPFVAKVDVDRSDNHSVVVNNVESNLAGKYRCEVTTDGPDFFTQIQSGYMHVVKLPEGNLTVRMEKPRYGHGDTVRGNCTAPPGTPPANITWTVNGTPVNSSYVKHVATKKDNRTRSVAGFEFELGTDSFVNGRLHVTCHADVFHLYKEQATISLEEERPRLASVLGTRETEGSGNTAKSAKGLILALLIADVILGSMR